MSLVVDLSESPASAILEAVCGFSRFDPSARGVDFERGVALLIGLVPALVELRDDGRLQFEEDFFDDFFTMDSLVDLAINERSGISQGARDQVMFYLESLPGFDSRRMIHGPAAREHFDRNRAMAARILAGALHTGVAH